MIHSDYLSLEKFRNIVGVILDDDCPGARIRGADFASRWGLKLQEVGDLEAKPSPFEFHLKYSASGLSLQWTMAKKMKPLKVDFLGAKMRDRLLPRNLKGDLLLKACGAKRGAGVSIFDPFLGLGGDAFFLAMNEYRVAGVELNPVIFALLSDGLKRASQAKGSNILSRLSIYEGGNQKFDWSRIDSGKADIVYLDPMFPKKKKSAAVNKDMQIIQSLYLAYCNQAYQEKTSSVSDSEAMNVSYNNFLRELIQWAKTLAQRKVILKRPRKYDVKLASIDYSIIGKSIRYDVFLVN